MTLHTPVAFFIFRRPDTTRRVFDAIRAARPSKLLIVADGARTPDEGRIVDETRAIVAQVDWDCEVRTQYAPANMGLKARVSSGLDWVFDQVEEAIILEDDCLPDPSFFPYCESLLDRYRDEPRVMHISGDCFHRQPAVDGDYYYSRYPHIWGWATWRRAWARYDVGMTAWHDPGVRARLLRSFHRSEERLFWRTTWDAVQRGDIDTWDYQWGFSCLLHDGLSINPAVNLIANIGFGADATHTIGAGDWKASLPTASIPIPPRCPPHMQPDALLDNRTADHFFTQKTLMQRAMRKARRLLGMKEKP